MDGADHPDAPEIVVPLSPLASVALHSALTIERTGEISGRRADETLCVCADGCGIAGWSGDVHKGIRMSLGISMPVGTK
jgi:hypothetical protein